MNTKETYEKNVVPALAEKFALQNKHAVPRLEKIVVNTGFGKTIGTRTGEEYRKTIDAVSQDISILAGQKAALAKARKSIAGFKLREGSVIGVRVTLRGKRMYDFFDRLVNIVLPRARDFQGIEPKSVDKQGNLTVGIREHIFFPEISPEKVKDIFGLEVVIVTTAKNREEGFELLKQLGFPFKKD